MRYSDKYLQVMLVLNGDMFSIFFLVGSSFSKCVLGSNANSNHFSKNQLYIKQANVYQVQVQLKARKTFLRRVRAHDSIWKVETFF